MSNTSSNQHTIEFLNHISIQIDRYLAIFIFLFAVMGNMLNILVLSQRTLRFNACAWLFLTSSIANLVSLLFGLTTRIMAGWLIDPTSTIDWICKCRAFILFTSRTTAFWLIALATVDRWLASSRNVRHRQMDTLKNIKRYGIMVIIFSALIYGQMLYCYEANMFNTPLKCYGKTSVCRIFSDIAYGIISVTLPLLLMIIFGLKTIYNVHHAQIHMNLSRVQTTSDNKNKKNIPINSKIRQCQWTRQDRHLFMMLSVQVIIQAILTIPQVLTKFYVSITMFQLQTPLKLAVDASIYRFTLLLSFLANGMPFYIYTLCGGNVFRKPLLSIVNIMVQKILWHR